MRRARGSKGLLVAVIGAAVATGCAPERERHATNVVRQVDHVLIATSRAEELFSLLTATLQLPIAWPMSDYGNFASGGVAVGDICLEVLRDSRTNADAAAARWTGLAFDPEPLRHSLAELDARSIRHGTAAPFRQRQPDGAMATRWTTVGLPAVSGDAIDVFLCQYEHDVAARRLRQREQLLARAGGPLSVRAVTAIVYGAKDVQRARSQWQALLDPLLPSGDGVWTLAAGPAIRMVEADADGIRGMVVEVASLPQARRFLLANDLLGAERPGMLTLAGPLLQGLYITLVG